MAWIACRKRMDARIICAPSQSDEQRDQRKETSARIPNRDGVRPTWSARNTNTKKSCKLAIALVLGDESTVKQWDGVWSRSQRGPALATPLHRYPPSTNPLGGLAPPRRACQYDEW